MTVGLPPSYSNTLKLDRRQDQEAGHVNAYQRRLLSPPLLEQRRSGGTCCQRKKSCCCACFFIFAMLVGGMIAAGILFWPKAPEVSLDSTRMVPGDSSVKYFLENGSLKATVSLKYISSFSVKNANFYGVHVKTISGKGAIVEFPQQTIGRGIVEDIHFDKEATTNVEFPFTIDLTAGKDNPIIRYIISNCATGEPLDIKYEISIDIPIISWTGYVLNIDRTEPFDCSQIEIPLPFSTK